MNTPGNSRPLSPHLQIYAPQLTSIMSIFHRFTGVGFSAGLFLLCIWLFSLSQGEKVYLDFCNFLANPLVKLVLYSILVCIYYHFLNGIRYMMWSFGKGYELNCVYTSGWLVTFLVIVITALTVYLV